VSFILSEILAKIQHYCAYQERCHQEVKSKLYELGCYTDTVNELLVKLIETGFLNEERFAIAYAGGKFRTKKWGRIKIKQELLQRKISNYCINSAMKAIDENLYAECISQLIAKKMPANPTWQDKQKVFKYMMGKGYETELIKEAMERNG